MINEEKLLAGLNALNSPPIPFTMDNVVLSPPSPFPGPDPWNTRVTISAIPTKGYSSGLDFYYHRVGLEEFGNDFALASNTPFTIASVVLLMNNFNIASDDERPELEVTDLEPVTIPTPYEHGDAYILDLKAKSGSYGWVGSNSVLLGYNLPDVDQLLEFFDEYLSVQLPA